MNQDSDLVTHRGRCHCGAIRFEVEAPADLEVHLCNCSICAMTSHLHLIVPKKRFHLLEGEEHLTTYTFNTGIAQHYFCSICGIKSFYIPRSNPDGVSVNARCLKPETVAGIHISDFDGRDWEKSAHALSHLSQDGV